MKSRIIKFLFSTKAGILAIVLLMAVGLLIKSTFLYKYDIIGVTRDSFTYGSLAFDLYMHRLPIFNMATPGYPIFLFLASVFTTSLDGSFLLQIVFHSLIVCVSLLLVLRFASQVFLPVFISLGLFYLSPEFLNQETIASTIALFTSFGILAVCLAICIVYNTDNKFLIGALSLACFAIIFIRPQGFYIASVLLPFTLFFVFTRRIKAVACLLGPFIVLFLLWLSYNKATFNKFAFSNYSAQVSLGSSMFLLEKSDKYGDGVNSAIDSVFNTFSLEEKNIIAHSWNYSELEKVFTIANWDKSWELQTAVMRNLHKTNYDDIAPVLEQIGSDGKRKNFDIYCKYVGFNLLYSQKKYASNFFFLYNELTNRVVWSNETTEFDSRLKLYPDASRFWMKQQYDDLVSKSLNGKGSVDVYKENFGSENIILKCYFYWQILYGKLVKNYAVLLLFYLSSFLLFILYLRRTICHKFFFALLFPVMAYAANSLLVSLSITPIFNYTFPLEFVVTIPTLSLIYWLILKRFGVGFGQRLNLV